MSLSVLCLHNRSQSVVCPEFFNEKRSVKGTIEDFSRDMLVEIIKFLVDDPWHYFKKLPLVCKTFNALFHTKDVWLIACERLRIYNCMYIVEAKKLIGRRMISLHAILDILEKPCGPALLLWRAIPLACHGRGLDGIYGRASADEKSYYEDQKPRKHRLMQFFSETIMEREIEDMLCGSEFWKTLMDLVLQDLRYEYPKELEGRRVYGRMLYGSRGDHIITPRTMVFGSLLDMIVETYRIPDVRIHKKWHGWIGFCFFFFGKNKTFSSL